MPYKRGKLPSQPPKVIKTFDQYIVTPLPRVNGLYDFGKDITFPMACNDSIGDCTLAGWVHAQQIAYKIAGVPYTYPGDTAVREEYFRLTGGQDTGLVETTVLNWGVKTGILGDKLAMWAPIKAGDKATMKAAGDAFGFTYLGCDPPQIAETQFANGQPWTLEPGTNPGVGGHCVVGAGIYPGGFRPVTWGREITATWNWWNAYKLTAYVLIPAVYVTTGHTPLANINLAQLQADCQEEARINAG